MTGVNTGQRIEEYIQTFQVDPQNILIEVALFLYREHKITLGKLAEIADITRLEAQTLIRSRGMGINYTDEDLENDLAIAQK